MRYVLAFIGSEYSAEIYESIAEVRKALVEYGFEEDDDVIVYFDSLDNWVINEYNEPFNFHYVSDYGIINVYKLTE